MCILALVSLCSLPELWQVSVLVPMVRPVLPFVHNFRRVRRAQETRGPALHEALDGGHSRPSQTRRPAHGSAAGGGGPVQSQRRPLPRRRRCWAPGGRGTTRWLRVGRGGVLPAATSGRCRSMSDSVCVCVTGYLQVTNSRIVPMVQGNSGAGTDGAGRGKGLPGAQALA